MAGPAAVTAVEAPWYDQALPGSWAMLPLDTSPALPTYEAAAAFVDPALPVVDLGCGTGRFAECLRRRGVTEYHGLDFASGVVFEAARYCQAPGFAFRVADLRDETFTAHATYVLLEVLEHLDDDLELLCRIQSGRPVVLSVPDFDSESHVRTFPDDTAAPARYGDLLDFREQTTLRWESTGNRVFVYSAVRL